MKTILVEQDFEIKAVRVEMEDGTYEVRCALYYEGDKLGIMQTPMSRLDKNVYKLRNFRATVSYPMLSNILAEIEDKYNELNIIHQVNGVGWQYNKDGALVGFAGAKYLGEDGTVVERESIDLPLKAKGMRFDTVKKINDYSAGNIKRQVLLAVGLSAPICGLLNENLVTALVGKTSIGKTISENLFKSLYAQVSNRTEFDFDDTENYITQSLSGNKGVFVAIDDTSLRDFNAVQLWKQIEKMALNDIQGFRLTQAEQKQLAERNANHEKKLKGENEIEDILNQSDNPSMKD